MGVLFGFMYGLYSPDDFLFNSIFVQLCVLGFFVSRVGLSLVGYVAHCDERGRVLFRITYVNAR